MLSLAPRAPPWPCFAAVESRSFSACLAISIGSWFSYSFDILIETVFVVRFVFESRLIELQKIFEGFKKKGYLAHMRDVMSV